MARKRELPPIEVKEIQREIALWAEQNFPERHKLHRKHIPIYRVSEALGNIYKSLYIQRTNRRHDPHTEELNQQEAVGKAIIHLVDFCSRHGWDFEHILRETWDETKGDDFDPYPDTGRPRKEDGPVEND